MSRLMVITSSTRPGRAGQAVADWVVDLAADTAFEVDSVDLQALALPLLDEPEHPSAGRYTQPHTKRWSTRVSEADAVVLVTPEYNHSFPASLKNALDFLYREWADKPVGVVSYGGVSAGTRAAAALAPVLASLQMRPVGAVHLQLSAHRSPQGQFAPTANAATAARTMLDSLLDSLLGSSVTPSLAAAAPMAERR